MKTIHVEFDVKVPAEATDDQIDEWVSFCTGERASISNSNPLVGHELEAEFVRISQ